MRPSLVFALALPVLLPACSTGVSVGYPCNAGENPDPCFAAGLACTPDYTDTSPTGAYCETPGELFECLAVAGCATGETCVGGDGGLCLASCTTTADCWDPLTTCQDAGGRLFCQPNGCTDIWQPCAASSPDGGDGTCLLVSQSSAGPSGACLQGGAVPDGGACNYFRGADAGLCVPGTVCVTDLNGSNVGLCMTACDATIGEDGGPICGGACTEATPPGPPPGLSSLDFFNRAGGCATACTSAEADTDAGCPNPTGCTPIGDSDNPEFACLP